jgi:hypothetical protein
MKMEVPLHQKIPDKIPLIQTRKMRIMKFKIISQLLGQDLYLEF